VSRSSAIRLAYGGLSPAAVDRYLDRFGSIDRVVEAIGHGRTKLGDTVCDAVRVDSGAREEELKSIGVSFLERGDSEYPSRLGRYPDHPRWLFSKGSLSDAPSIGIVGSRACTSYGAELAERYGEAAAGAGWAVVSGLARGIDAAAHRGAIGASGSCVAVLGSGIDVVYPRSNHSLHQQILEGSGSVLSEFPPGTRPDGWRFPTRNRVIAGLSDVVLVVEASERGGALITARIALDYGVPVYAVPGDVDRPTSEGANRLIRDGAFPIFGPDDLATVLSLVTPLVRST
jgi:DNA processing protein